MTEKIKWSAQIDIAAGPKLSIGDTLEVEAYDKVAFSLDADATDVKVDLQPGGAGQVQLLVIKASAYDAGLTFSPDGGTTDFTLDAPLILVGTGPVGLLGTAPKQLQWSNGTDDVVMIDILIGRDATPPPTP